MKRIACCFALMLSLSSFIFAREANGWSGQTGNQLLPHCIAAEEIMDGKHLSRERAELAVVCMHPD